MSQFSLYERKVLGKRKCHWFRIRINKFIKKIIKMMFSVNGVGFVGDTILEKLPWDRNFLS